MKHLIFILLLMTSLSSLSQDWTEPVVIDEGATGFGFAIDSNGVLHCVWSHEVETDFHKIFYAKSEDDGLTWSAPVDITQNSTMRHDEPKIVVDSNNYLYVSYSHNVASIPETMIYFLVFDGIAWSTPAPVSEGFPGSWGSKLVKDNNNRIYCFWYHPVNGGTICYRYFENDTWSPVNQLFSGSNDYFYFIMAAVDHQNTLHCIGAHHYEGQTVYDNRVIYFTFNDTVWSPFTDVGTTRVYGGTTIDLDTDYMPVIVWVQETGGTELGLYGTYISSLSSGGVWSYPEFIIDTSSYSSFNISAYNSYNIVTLERPYWYTFKLVNYIKKDQEWEGQVLEVSNQSMGSIELQSRDSSLYLFYIKSNESEYLDNSILFRRKDLLTANMSNDVNRHLTIFPNPCSDFVLIDIPDSYSTEIYVTLFNMYGKIVNQEQLFNNGHVAGNTHRFELVDGNKNKLPCGIYFLSVSSNNHETNRCQKILIQ